MIQTSTILLADDLSDLPQSRRPRHIAIIMDGNGRWAQRRELPRVEGHRQGVAAVRRITEASARLGIEQLTLYCLSCENWKRPQHELDFLMQLLQQYLIEERATILEQNIRMAVIGRRDGIPAGVQREMDKTIDMSCKNTGLRLCLAINYGGRQELVDAMRRTCRAVQSGSISAEEVTEKTIADRLYTAGMPDPDLLIRTASEMRLSNFLLWQAAYAELAFIDLNWPEFTKDSLEGVIREYQGRERRYGATNA